MPRKVSYQTRMPNAALLPYKLLTILLYGQFGWLKRDGQGWARCPVLASRNYLKTNPENLRCALTSLENWGVIKKYHWYKNWFEVELEIPQGMALYTPAIILTARKDSAELFEFLGDEETATSIARQTDPRHPLNREPQGEIVKSWREDDGQE